MTGFVFVGLFEELWKWNSLEFTLACLADVTVSSSLIAFEQKLFEMVSEYPLLYDSSWRDFQDVQVSACMK